MKNKLAALFFLFSSSLILAQNDWSNFIITQKDGKYGVTDSLGNMIVPHIYYSINKSRDGLADIRVGNVMENKFGKMNKEGKIIIPPLYWNKITFEDNLAILNGQFFSALVNIKGEYVKKIQGGRIMPFMPGIYKVYLRNKYGTINQKGETIVPIIYDEIYVERMHIALTVRLDKKIGYLIKNKGGIHPRVKENFIELPDTSAYVNYKILQNPNLHIQIGNQKLKIDELNRGNLKLHKNPKLYKYPNFEDMVIGYNPKLNIETLEMIGFSGLGSKDIFHSTKIKRKKFKKANWFINLKGQDEFIIESIMIKKIPINKKPKGYGFALNGKTRTLQRNKSHLIELSKNSLNELFENIEKGDVYIVDKITFFNLAENVPIDFTQAIRIEIK